MSNDLFGSQGPGDRLYADAVCAQCGTVNPESTLICKTCGNNLRDQRTIRLAADAELTAQAKPVERRRVVLGLLTVLGILLVLWMVFNVDTLANWLVNSQQTAINIQGTLWKGKDSAIFNQLLDDLDAVEFSAAESRAALANPTASESMDGFYVLGVNGPLGSRPVGSANALLQEETLYFVARVGETVEIRGKAQQQGSSWTASWESAGAQQGELYYSVAGIGVLKPEGYWECFGQAEISEDGYEFIAGKISVSPSLSTEGE
ncbi:MAG TPA: hypothetical protein PLI09_21900 [Candidatus Hydrogenedentes bacterium]|nr:hypothetical protein [Candidatus Hydrogenedentota bacterium]